MSTFADHHRAEIEIEIEIEEDERVSRWRHSQFRTLGFGEEDARLLSESDVDLNQARFLISAGCPLNLALKILI